MVHRVGVSSVPQVLSLFESWLSDSGCWKDYKGEMVISVLLYCCMDMSLMSGSTCIGFPFNTGSMTNILAHDVREDDFDSGFTLLIEVVEEQESESN